jgi:hypothetical protein
MPKGKVTAKTLQKEEAKARLREMIIARLEPILEAGMDSATGIKHFMLRDPDTGQFRRLTDPAEIEAALNAPGAAEGSTYWIYVKDPSVQAMADLLNRAIGKPVEEVQAEVKGGLTIRWKAREE